MAPAVTANREEMWRMKAQSATGGASETVIQWQLSVENVNGVAESNNGSAENRKARGES